MIVPKPMLSLFSGAGGLDLAFESTGYFASKVYIESERLFAETIRLNQRMGNLHLGQVVEESIVNLDPVETWTKHNSTTPPWGIIGGPPCESFSPIGKQKGRHDHRGALVFDFARWVRELAVSVFVMENVPGLVSIEKGELFKELLQHFEASGFGISYGIVCAADYGAATVRRRLFVVGTRGLPKFMIPSATHAEFAEENLFFRSKPWVTAEEALAGLPQPATQPPGMPQGHVLISHTAPVRERFKALLPGAVDPVRKRNKLHPKRPSPGLYAGNLGGIRLHIHPHEPRELTNREAARIQGFPDNYTFNGSRVPVGKQITNAVPIALGRAFADALAEQYLGKLAKPNAA